MMNASVSVLTIEVKDSGKLPTRAKNVLIRLECETVKDVIKLTPAQILRAKWAGKKVLAHIEAWLGSFGLSLTIPADTLPSPAGFPLLNGYLQIQKQLFDYFGYAGLFLPMEDCTSEIWQEWSPETTYRGKDFTMIVASSTPQRTRLGRVLAVYDNTKESKTQTTGA